METFFKDIRYAVRTLLKRRGFTSLAVLTLALGIGACTAIFSVVNGVLLRSLPYPEAERLVELQEVTPSGKRISFAEPNFLDVRARSDIRPRRPGIGQQALLRGAARIPSVAAIVEQQHGHPELGQGGGEGRPERAVARVAIEDEHGIAIIAGHRLAAMLQIDDLQAHRTQRHVSRFPDALLIGAAMGQRARDPLLCA